MVDIIIGNGVIAALPERLRQCNGDSDSTEVDGIYPEEESMQKSVQVNVQDNGNSGGVLWENINRHLQ